VIQTRLEKSQSTLSLHLANYDGIDTGTSHKHDDVLGIFLNDKEPTHNIAKANGEAVSINTILPGNDLYLDNEVNRLGRQELPLPMSLVTPSRFVQRKSRYELPTQCMLPLRASMMTAWIHLYSSEKTPSSATRLELKLFRLLLPLRPSLPRSDTELTKCHYRGDANTLELKSPAESMHFSNVE
jgi:hypothetical protein